MGRNPLTNPLHYASPQWQTGSPATDAEARRQLQGYDYGMIITSSLIPIEDVELIENSHCWRRPRGQRVSQPAVRRPPCDRPPLRSGRGQHQDHGVQGPHALL